MSNKKISTQTRLFLRDLLCCTEIYGRDFGLVPRRIFNALDEDEAGERMLAGKSLDNGDSIYCGYCGSWLNAYPQWMDHKIGKKHKKNLEKVDNWIIPAGWKEIVRKRITSRSRPFSVDEAQTLKATFINRGGRRIIRDMDTISNDKHMYFVDMWRTAHAYGKSLQDGAVKDAEFFKSIMRDREKFPIPVELVDNAEEYVHDMVKRDFDTCMGALRIYMLLPS